MQYEKSCGGVVFTRRNHEILYVVIRHTSGHCGFPKGHMEPGEAEQETALREIREETGLTCRFLEGFRAEEQYPLPNKPGTMKQVVYFLGEYSNQSFYPQPEEISRIDLLPFEEALALLPFRETKRVLSDAHAFLQTFR